MGRKTTFTKVAAKKICEELSKGVPLATICKDPDMPAVRTVSDWKKENKEFAADFAHAREEGHDALAAGCLEIADAPLELKKAKRGHLPMMASDVIAQRKMMIDTRLKLLAKWDKRYSNHMTVDHNVNNALAERLSRAKARKARPQA